VKAHIERDPLTAVVKVWLYRDDPAGRIFMWPMGYPDPSHKCMTWMQEIVPNLEALPDTIRPALEMTGSIWDAFIMALRGAEGFSHTVDEAMYQLLKREQARVDVLINALINLNVPVHAVLETIGPPHGETAYSDGGGASYGGT
jgi:hypothetical protein